MTRTRPGLAGALLVLLLALACSGGDDPDIAVPGERAGAPEDAGEDADDPAVDPLLGETFHVAQAVDDTLVVREAAQETSDELVTLSAADEPSGLIVCLVEQQIGDWLQVRLPTGPPDRTGWVARDDVTLSRHRFHIEVSLGERTLTLYTGEIEALSVPVAVGPDAPGAGEVRYIKELVQVPAQAPTYGRFAYGLSGSTTTLEALTAGEGVVAIHGTPDESRLGGAVDRGAVAVGDDILTRFVETIGLPLGTPVRFVE
ncbi:MAG: hypothetical protein C0P77_007140 [Thermoanaerobacterales bacterium]|jgi:hypothetical protein